MAVPHDYTREIAEAARGIDESGGEDSTRAEMRRLYRDGGRQPAVAGEVKPSGNGSKPATAKTQGKGRWLYDINTDKSEWVPDEQCEDEAETRERPEGYDLAPLDWQALLAHGVPEVEYIAEPYFPKLARIWVWGATGSMKSLYCEWQAARLSRAGKRVSYFSEENPIREELRRLARLQPDPEHFRLFHRTGMDLADPTWVDLFLETIVGDDITFLDSLTDLWGGDEGDNRAVQLFDAAVLKPAQARGVTPVVLHHTGHRQMFSDRGGATAGRGASALGQKADVVLEFKSAGDDLFTIVYGKCRIGGVHHPERSFKVEDCDDETLDIVEAGSPEEFAVQELAEKIVAAVQTAPQGRLTTSELRAAIGGRKERQTAALALLANDPRIRSAVEKMRTKDNRVRDARVWRPAGAGLGDGFDFGQDGEPRGTTHPPIGVGDALSPSFCVPSDPSRDVGEDLGTSSPGSERTPKERFAE